jgi:hypothetical protein
MAAFVSTQISVANATAVKVLDSAEMDRKARFANASGDGTAVHLAYSSGTASGGVRFATVADEATFTFGGMIIPAGEELWVYQTTGSTVTFDVITTSVGR